ncbi:MULTISPECIES: hypothetical protein [unclassified Frankia]|uniref:hypothetical protein n=1 Tax=unclassified Frankia TaxID=2632575 RepID=UPI002AD4E6D6|nr:MULTISPECIES: hypothetical protein [unclassified Frankia]
MDGLSAAVLYAVIFTLVFVDSGILVVFWLPGDTILVAAGMLAADPDAGVSSGAPTPGIPLVATAGAVMGHVSALPLDGPRLERRHVRILARPDVSYQHFGTLAPQVARSVRRVRTFAPCCRALLGVTRGSRPGPLVARPTRHVVGWIRGGATLA